MAKTAEEFTHQGGIISPTLWLLVVNKLLLLLAKHMCKSRRSHIQFNITRIGYILNIRE